MIQVEGLTKYYGPTAAIRDLTFTIQKGEVIGFLGRNGAGKSTTLKVLGCVLLPTSGKVRIEGYDVVRDPHEIRKKIGFLPDTPPLYNEMTVGGYLAFVGQLRGLSPGDIGKRVGEVERKTGLVEVHEAMISSLSHGYRQRVGLAQAIVHNPELLILDEPSSGLDPGQNKEMRELIRNLRGSHTILISSHNLNEISQTCDRLLVIDKGEIVAQETEQNLANRFGSTRIEVEIGGAPERAVPAIKTVPGVGEVTVSKQEGASTLLIVQAAAELRPKIVRALVQADIDVMRIDRESTQLESIFLKLTQGTN